VIAVDTNLLVYAHREDSEWHVAAADCLTRLAEGKTRWAVLWPCVHEFVAIATHPRIFAPPSPLPAALDQVDAWLESPAVVLLSEEADYWPTLRKLLGAARAVGPKVHDTRIVALCLLHGVDELWSADRDFHRYPQLKVRNPLIG